MKAALNGWLDRRGKFYPCKFNNHFKAAYKLEKQLKLQKSLEYLGWVKVHNTGVWFFVADEYYDRHYVRITQNQEKWLLDNGYEFK